MTEQLVILKSGGWSMWDDKTPRPRNVGAVICAADDPDYMQKVNAALNHTVFTEAQIADHKRQLSEENASEMAAS